MVRLGEGFAGAIRVVIDESAREYTLLPAWMFEPRCDQMRIESQPRAAVWALMALRALLTAVAKMVDVESESTEIRTHAATEPTLTKATDRVAAPAGAEAPAVDRAARDMPAGGDPAACADAGAARPRHAKRRRGRGTR